MIDAASPPPFNGSRRRLLELIGWLRSVGRPIRAIDFGMTELTVESLKTLDPIRIEGFLRMVLIQARQLQAEQPDLASPPGAEHSGEGGFIPAGVRWDGSKWIWRRLDA